MPSARSRAGSDATEAEVLPVLIFLRRTTSGPSRKMESLVAWVNVTRKKRLRVIEVDADLNPALVKRLGVTRIPALVLTRDGEVLGRLEGPVKGQDIETLISEVIDG
jgi:thioredoxin-like negative regulator of GroEL